MRKTRKARTWKAWAVLEKGWEFRAPRFIKDTEDSARRNCFDEHGDRVIPVEVREIPARARKAKGGK